MDYLLFISPNKGTCIHIFMYVRVHIYMAAKFHEMLITISDSYKKLCNYVEIQMKIIFCVNIYLTILFVFAWLTARTCESAIN